jgi:hypothetical protein
MKTDAYNVHIRHSGLGAVVAVETDESTMIRYYETMRMAGKAAFGLGLIEYVHERTLQKAGSTGYSGTCDIVDILALRGAGFRLVVTRP